MRTPLAVFEKTPGQCLETGLKTYSAAEPAMLSDFASISAGSSTTICLDSGERAFLLSLSQKADQHRRSVDRIEGRIGVVDPVDVKARVRATTTAIQASTGINTATGNVQFADVLYRWSLKFSHLRDT